MLIVAVCNGICFKVVQVYGGLCLSLVLILLVLILS
jgi:hypothetical protein